jgi:hypothetical protein
MDNERREFLREKINNNDPEYVKWGQDRDGNPIKWVRTSTDGDWILYKEDDYLPVTERISNAFWGVIGFIGIAILIYAVIKGDLTLF